MDLNWYSFPERETHGKQTRNGSSLSRYSLSMPFKTVIDKSKPTGWCATPSFFYKKGIDKKRIIVYNVYRNQEKEIIKNEADYSQGTPGTA